MTSLEQHKNNFEQFMKDVEEKIRANLLVERQKIIGFDTSEAATNILEYFLHNKNLISSGFRVNHNYFASEKRAQRHLDFDFPKKNELISLMVKQDELRNLLSTKKRNIISLGYGYNAYRNTLFWDPKNSVPEFL